MRTKLQYAAVVLLTSFSSGASEEKAATEFAELIGSRWQALVVGSIDAGRHPPTLFIKAAPPPQSFGSEPTKDSSKARQLTKTLGSIAGSGGCNAYSAGFASNGPEIKFTQFTRTAKLCHPMHRMNVEELFGSLMIKVTHWSMTNERLALSSGEEGEHIVFLRIKN